MASRTIKALDEAGALASSDREREAKDGDGQGSLYIVDKEALDIEGSGA